MSQSYWWRRRKQRLDIDDLLLLRRYVFAWHGDRAILVSVTRLGVTLHLLGQHLADGPKETRYVEFEDYPQYAAIFNERGWDLQTLAQLLDKFLPTGGSDVPPPISTDKGK